VKITESTVRAASLPAGKRDVIHFDDRLKGFGLRLQGASRKYVLQYRGPRGEDRRFLIGSTDEVTATQARETAAKLLAGIKLGQYPHIAREQQRRAAEHELDIAKQTLGAISKLYLDYHQRTFRAGSHKIARYHINTSWACLHKVPISSLDRRMVAQRLAEIVTENGPVAANKARSVLSAFFNWAGGEGLIDGNPVKFTNKQREKPRSRALSDAELVAIWRCAGDDAYGKVIRILLLTGQRRAEIGGMRWSELHVEQGQTVLRLPDHRSKTGEPHILPLVPAVVSIIESVPRMQDRDTIFGGAKAGFDDFSNGKRRLDARIAEQLGAPLAPWHLHDLRHSMKTIMSEKLRIRGEVSEALLNHKKKGMDAAYNHAVYREDKFEALTKWAGYIDAIVTGVDRKVVSLRAKEVSA
jgi:integrase